LNLIHLAAQRPQKKYAETQMESQEISWETKSLLSEASPSGSCSRNHKVVQAVAERIEENHMA
ncbi:Protein FAM183A, partial [Sciurus carolinensis]|nr:Protein FAM183A [Sciurus carolinensis]